jgi:hypothetical protein
MEVEKSKWLMKKQKVWWVDLSGSEQGSVLDFLTIWMPTA